MLYIFIFRPRYIVYTGYTPAIDNTVPQQLSTAKKKAQQLNSLHKFDRYLRVKYRRIVCLSTTVHTERLSRQSFSSLTALSVLKLCSCCKYQMACRDKIRK